MRLLLSILFLLLSAVPAHGQGGDFLRDSDRWHNRAADVFDNSGVLWCGASSGSSNDYDLSPTIKVDNYVDGYQFLFVADKTNSGAATASVSGRATADIKKPGAVALSAGDIVSGEYYFLTYRSSADDFILTQSSQSLGVAAIAALGTGIVTKTGTATYAVRTLTMPAAGITGSNLNGVAGNPTLALANDLAALEALASTGLAARTGSDAWAQRTLTMPAAGITGSNLDGVSGNPTLALANDLSAFEALDSTAGLLCKTGSEAYARRTLTAPVAGITVSNGSCAAGNPTLVLADDLNGLEGLSTTGFADRTGTSTWATRTLTGTTNQVSVTNGGGGGDPVFSTPQNIHTGATPTFDELRLGNASADIRGTAGTQIISMYGGNTSGGGGVDFYGVSHATLPGRVDLFSGSAAGSLNINARASTINMNANAGATWQLSNNNFGVASDLGGDLGLSSSFRFSNVYSPTLHSGASACTIKSTSGDSAYFNTSGLVSIPRGDLEFTNNGDQLVYHGDTDRSLTFRGGSTSSAAYVQAWGQSHATTPGKLDIYSGANGITLRTRSASAIAADINSANVWNFATDGDLDPSADDTRSIGSATNRVTRIGVLNLDAGSGTLTLENTGSDRAQMDSSGNITVLTGTFRSNRTTDLGWTVVDGTDNTACTSQCTSAAVFGFNLAAGATAPVIVGPADATADICLCAGAS